MQKTLILLFLITGCGKINPVPPTNQGKESTPHTAQSVTPTTLLPSPIAELLKPIEDVQIRRAKHLIWQKGSDKSPLQNYDTVKTGDASSGQIHFNDNTRINVEEKTMIIILEKNRHPKSEQSVIALPSGAIRGELESHKEKKLELVVKTKRIWIRAASEPFNSQSQKEKSAQFEASLLPSGELKIKNNRGSLSLLAKNGEKSLSVGASILIPRPVNSEKLHDDEAFETIPSFKEKDWVLLNSQKKNQDFNLKKSGIKNEFRIETPSNKSIISSSKTVLTGKILGLLEVYLNGKKIMADLAGSFRYEIELSPGVNLLTFQIVGPSPNEIRYETLELIRQ